MRHIIRRVTSLIAPESRCRTFQRACILACLSVLFPAAALSQSLDVSAIAGYDRVHHVGFGIRAGHHVTEVAGDPASYYVGARVLYFPNQFHVADPTGLGDVKLDNSAVYAGGEIGMVVELGAVRVQPLFLAGLARTSWEHIFIGKTDGAERRIENRARFWYAPTIRIEAAIGRLSLGGELSRVGLRGSTEMQRAMRRDRSFVSMQISLGHTF